MSTDFDAACFTCRKATHLGQRMGGTHSFGHGTNDTEAQAKIAEWIMEHIYHDLRIKECEDHDLPTVYVEDSDFLAEAVEGGENERIQPPTVQRRHPN